jgi:lipopolysaccharide transport system ATP-binding protein
MEKPIIEVRKIGKKYDITHERGGYIALRDIIANAAKNPFSFLKRKVKRAIGLAGKEEFWALKDISFNVKRGEVVGVIGANGAGKSTLFKILSRITPPNEGEIVIRGRVGSLLEVGTGFHPELTGRENIFLNGAILGMRQREIAKRFDEIVEFAGVEKFLDTPVKYYSSGMYVRLAFSVAAHMEPDILLIDEVLAVGDAEFQKKCLGKMDEITKKEGRTILFVSHNMGAISQLCQKTVLIKNGHIAKMGETSEIVSMYLSERIKSGQAKEFPADKTKNVKIRSVIILDSEGKESSNIKMFEPFKIKITYDVNEKTQGIHALIACTDIGENHVFVSGESDANASVLGDKEIGSHSATFGFPGGPVTLNKGTYFIKVTVGPPAMRSFDTVIDIPLTIIEGENEYSNLDGGRRKGLVLLENTWNTNAKGKQKNN